MLQIYNDDQYTYVLTLFTMEGEHEDRLLHE